MKLFKNKYVAIIATAIVILGCLGYGMLRQPASMVTPTFGDWVLDEAGILSDETEQLLANYNAKWDNSYSSIVAVATVDSTRNWEMSQYAMNLGEKWGLGSRDMLLLLDVKEQNYWLAYGGDVVEKHMGESVLIPAFNRFISSYYAGEYDTALTGLFSDFDQCYAENFYKVNLSSDYSASNYEYYYTSDSSGSSIMSIILLLIIIFAIASITDRRRYDHWVAGGRSTTFVPLIFWHRPGSAWVRRRPMNNVFVRSFMDGMTGHDSFSGNHHGGVHNNHRGGGGFGGGRGGGFGGGGFGGGGRR